MHPHVTYIVAQERIAEIARGGRTLQTGRCGAASACRWQTLEDPANRAPGRHRLRQLFMRQTLESRYRRYLSPKRALSERELDHLVDVDHVHHEALAAEVAIEVPDDLHKRGIGRALAIRTLERARANGFTRVTANTLHENAPARALLRALHFRPRSGGSHELEFELELTPDLT
jgi:GNAT superfamily N-acetyltransferase